MIVNKLHLIFTASLLGVFLAGQSVALDDWQDEFKLSSRKLTDTGEAKYFVLTPGFQIVLANADTTLTLKVLNETKTINHVFFMHVRTTNAWLTAERAI